MRETAQLSRLLLFACTLVLFRSSTFPAQQPSIIQGTVSDLGSGQPIPNALIILSGDAGYFRITSDSSGRFLIEGMASGDYKAEVSRDGYLWSKRQSGPATLTVAPSLDLRTIAFRLLKASAISGRILNEYGEPDSTISVAALRLEYRNGIRVLSPVRPTGGSRASTVTDRKGEYRLYGLEPGEYYLRAGSRSSGGTYYPGTTDPNLAVSLTVLPGRDLTGIGLTVLRAQMNSVTVTLSPPDSTSASLLSTPAGSIRPKDPSRLVDLTATDGSSPTSIGPDRYRSALLLPGEYEWSLVRPSRLFGRIAFTITDHDIDLGTVELNPLRG